MPLMRKMDAETSHDLSIFLASLHIHPRDFSKDDPVLKTTLWGKNFRNPIGVAAGFDKHAKAIDALNTMGFGFVEVFFFFFFKSI